MTNFRQPRLVLPEITKAANGEECTIRHPDHCNGNPETTVFCHDDFDKPFGRKNDDIHGAFGCSGCHDWMDKTRDEDRLFYMHRGMKRTQRRLMELGILVVMSKSGKVRVA